MSSETIQEFLVSLGWESNKAAQKEFEGAIQSATLRAKLLGDGLEELARKVLDSVGTIASHFDMLYFQAQRTNTSAAAVSDFVKVMAQAGVSAGEAESSIESMAQKLRAGSIAVQDLNRMGFGLNPLTGQLEIQSKYVAGMATMSDALLVAGAHQIGMSEQVAFALKRQGGTALEQLKRLEDYRRALGFDYKKAEEDGHRLMSVWRDTSNKLTAIFEKMGDGLSVAMIGPLEKLDKFLTENAPDIGKDIDIIMKALSEMTAQWTKDLDKILNDPVAMNQFKTDMHEVAVSIADMAHNFRDFIKDMIWLNNEGNKFADILNHLTGQKESGTGWNDAKEFVGPDGPLERGTRAAEGLAPGDNRTVWERIAPKWAGGKDAPTAIDGATEGGGDRHHSAATGEAMRIAMDQLRKEGVPEESLRPAAALLVGNALAESGLDPNTSHDGGTGYGIYGAHLERRERMLSWLEKNGYAKNSLEGQMRYMAHEAMGMGSVAPMLRGATTENLLANSWGFTHSFENPKVVNNRTGDVRAAYAAAGGPAGTGAVMPGAGSPDSIVERLRSMRAAGLISNEQCVSLAAASVGLRPGQWHVTDWRRGESAAAGTMQPGQPLATFLDANGQPSNRYAGGGTGTPGAHRDHAGVFQNYIKDAAGNNIGFNMAEQYAGSGGIHSHAYYFGQGWGEGDASNYSSIKTARGSYLGGAAPAAKEAAKAAAQTPVWNGLGGAGAFGGNLLGGVKPTLGGAAPAASTKVDAPMDTTINIHGSPGDGRAPEMVAAGITHKPAEGTALLQGATA